jgi:hypothetical protein
MPFLPGMFLDPAVNTISLLCILSHAFLSRYVSYNSGVTRLNIMSLVNRPFLRYDS